MAIARRHVVDDQRPGCYHLVSRCVRRTWLCGPGAEHRKHWLEDRIALCAKAFGIEVLAVAVMSNHLHLVVRTRPDAAQEWTAMAVAERWATVYPRRDRTTGEALPADQGLLQAWAHNPVWVAEHRRRLANLGWFMKTIKEPLARMANREDNCTGAFWEGRFHATALLDQPAITACMAYVDLNPIRAGIADTPETSDHTSIQQRIRARQAYRRRSTILDQRSGCDAQAILERERLTTATGPEAGLWLAPMSACQRSPTILANPPTLDDYLTLVDTTGRCIRSGKHGHIDPRLPVILDRLDLDLDCWLHAVTRGGSFRGSAVGTAAAHAAEAIKRGVAWIADKIKLHRPRPAPA